MGYTAEWPVNIAFKTNEPTLNEFCLLDGHTYRRASPARYGLRKDQNGQYEVHRVFVRQASRTVTTNVPTNARYGPSQTSSTRTEYYFPSSPSTYYYVRQSAGKAYALNTYSIKTSHARDVWKSENDRELSSGSASSAGANLSSSSMAPYGVALDANDRLITQLTDLRRQMDRIAKDEVRGIQSLESSSFSSSYAMQGAVASLKAKATEKLKSQGYTDAQIAWFFDPSQGNPTSILTKPQSGSNGSRSTVPNTATPSRDTIAPTPATRKVTIRTPFGYAPPPTKARDQRPQIIQSYSAYVKDPTNASGKRRVNKKDIFYFPFVPNSITYAGLGSEWVEIDRQGNYPIVEWSKWNLMKVDMEFTIAEERLEGSTLVTDGIYNSVQARIDTLRRMSQRRATVSLFNLDDMFRVQLKRAQETGKAMEFVITDLQVTSLRRSEKSATKEITAASVRLSLQEIPIEKLTVVKFTLPEFSVPVPEVKKQTNDQPPTVPLLSTVVNQGTPYALRVSQGMTPI